LKTQSGSDVGIKQMQNIDFQISGVKNIGIGLLFSEQTAT